MNDCDHIVGILYDYGGDTLVKQSELEGWYMGASTDWFDYCPECGAMVKGIKHGRGNDADAPKDSD